MSNSNEEYSASNLSKMDLAGEEAMAYVEAEKTIITENLEFLNTIKEILFSISMDSVRINNNGGDYSGYLLSGEKIKAIPNLSTTLRSLDEAEMDWIFISAYPSKQSIEILLFSKSISGIGFNVFLDSPPYTIDSYPLRQGYVEINEEWGIRWQVNSMGNM